LQGNPLEPPIDHKFVLFRPRIAGMVGNQCGTARLLLLMGVSQMPLWLEILINVVGYAGFIAIAMYHKPRNGNSPDQIK
jgi:hypothetical protein